MVQANSGRIPLLLPFLSELVPLIGLIRSQAKESGKGFISHSQLFVHDTVLAADVFHSHARCNPTAFDVQTVPLFKRQSLHLGPAAVVPHGCHGWTPAAIPCSWKVWARQRLEELSPLTWDMSAASKGTTSCLDCSKNINRY